MNRIFKIIFNRSTGRLEVVSELASSQSAIGGATAVTKTNEGLTVRSLSALLMLLAGTASWLSPAVAQEATAPQAIPAVIPAATQVVERTQIVADKSAPGSQQATVLATANGSVQVNITTPSKNGVSMNQYSQFDVGPNGAILNNSRGNVNTQTAGWIQGNPWLATGTARIIVNQVNSVNPSYLQGNIEVAGDRAEVVMANAAGIAVNGAGFINAAKVTLTTGTPLVNGGALDGYRVTQGQVRVDGEGLNTGDADYTAIFARSLAVNAGIWSKELTVVTGANEVKTDASSAAISGTGAAPTVAIDSSSLGGMYANKITLIGTEAGVGFNNAGTIAAGAGQVHIDVNGHLSNAGTVAVNGAQNDLSVKSSGLHNSGTLSAQGNTRLDVADTTTNAGLIASGRELTVNTQGLNNTDGTLNAQRIAVTADALDNTRGKLVQTGAQRLDLRAGELINTNKGLIGAVPLTHDGGSGDPQPDPTLPADTPPTSATGGSTGTVVQPTPETFADGVIHVSGKLNNDAGTITANGGMDLRSETGLINTNGAQILVDALDVKGATLNNDGGRISAAQAAIATQTLSNVGGQIGSSSALTIASQNVDNTKGTLSATTTLDVSASGQLTNTEGTLAANKDVSVSAGAVDGANGIIVSNTGALNVKSEAAFNSDGGTLQAATDLNIASGELTTANGSVHAKNVTINTNGNALHNANGSITADTLSVASGDLENDDGVIAAAGALTLTANALSNQRGAIGSGGDLSLRATSLDNREGTIQSGASATLDVTQQLNNTDGLIAAQNTLSIGAGSVDNTRGVLAAVDGALNFRVSGAFTNTGGTLQSGTDLTLRTQGFDNRDGALIAGNLDLDTGNGALQNDGGTLAGNTVTLASTGLSNDAGLIQAQNELRIDTRDGELVNTNSGEEGGIRSGGTLDVKSGDANNRAGVIVAVGDLNWIAKNIQSTEGVLSASSNITLNAASLDSSKGIVQAGKTLTTNLTGALTNTQGEIVAGHGAQITAGAVTNTQGSLATANGDLTLISNGALTNTGGRVQSANALQLNAGSLDNSAGVVAAQTTASLNVANDLTNMKGDIVANDALSLTTGSLSNTDGRIGSLSSGLNITASNAVTNTNGQIASATTTTITASSLENQRGAIAGEEVAIGTGSGAINNNDGTISATNVQLDSGTLSNVAGLIQGTNTVGIDTQGGTLTNTQSGSDRGIRAGNTLSVRSGTLDNTSGILASSQAANIAATNILNGNGQIAAGTALNIAANTLNNESSVVQSGGNVALQLTGALDSSNGLIVANDALVIGASSVDNSDGVIGSIAGDVTLDSVGLLKNTGGQIQSTKSVRVNANGIDNINGLIFGDALVVQGGTSSLNNDGGTLAGNTVSISSGALSNTAGLIQSASDLSLDTKGQTLTNTQSGSDRGIRAGTTLAITSGNLNNTTGLIGAGSTLAVDSASLTNTDGVMQSGGAMAIDAKGVVTNTGGTLVSSADLSLAGNGVDNTQGTIFAQNMVGVNTNNATLTNDRGHIGGSHVAVTSGDVHNDAGLIQGVQTVTVNASGTLTNANNFDSAGISSGGTLSLNTAKLANDTGTVFSAGDASIHATSLSNAGGQIGSQSKLTLTGSTLDNRSGSLQSAGDLRLDAGIGSVNNTDGMIGSQNTVTITAANVINDNTKTDGKGIGAKTVVLNADTISNVTGSIFAQDTLHINGTGELNNTGGELLAGNVLRVQDATYQRTVLNEGGTIAAGSLVSIQGKALRGNGTLESGLDAELDQAESINNAHTLQANRDLTLSTQGDLRNSGTLLAGRALTVNATNVDNTQSGEISSTLTTVNASNSVTNRGLIDGALTHIAANQIDNLGTGRLYGDHVALQANTLNNTAETVDGVSKAATIAARERLDLGVGTLSNENNALIYSGGDASIGGTLDANRLATGTATAVNNVSATIDIDGDLAVNAQTLVNERPGVTVNTQAVQSIDQTVTMNLLPWQMNGSNSGALKQTSNYRASQVYYLNPNDILDTQEIVTPDGQRVTRATIKVTPQTSIYYFGRGGMNDSRGERERVIAPDGTITVYYKWREDGQSNPDQVSGGDNPFATLAATAPGRTFSYERDNLTYSSSYGTCTTNCVQITATYQFTDPMTQIQDRIQGTDHSNTEEKRIAHHTAMDDTVTNADAAQAIIRSGGSMALTVGDLTNRYGAIAAGGDLLIQRQDGGTSSVTNIGQTLYRTHRFSNISIGYGGQQTAWTAPDLSEIIGQVGGTIVANGTLVIDSDIVSNLDQGRDAPNVLDRSVFVNLNTGSAPLGTSVTLNPTTNVQVGTRTLMTNIIGATATDGAAIDGDVLGNSANLDPNLSNVTLSTNAGIDAVNPTQTNTANPNISILTNDALAATVPNNSLFVLNPNATGTYFETDPRFTGYRNWLSSDWMLGQLGIDPLSMHKRLGDGYYEQKLIRDQIAQLTGRRFLDGYSSDDAQYKALMQAGLTFAGEFGLRPGIALTAEQLARLTSDIVWLVERDVTLPDGSKVKALVPQVYVAVRKGDLSNTGALLAANQIQLNLTGDLTNSGSIAGRDIVSLNALNIHNLKGASISGGQVGLTALNDITNIGGTLKATDALVLNAGRDITMSSTTQSQSGSGPYSWSQTGIDRVAGLYVTNPNGLGILALNAGSNITLNAVTVSNAGQNGITQIKAGNTINLGTVGTAQSQNYNWDPNNYTRIANTRDVGTTISSANHVVLDAGADINAKAANIYSANGQVALVAGNNVNLQAGTNTDTYEDARKWKSSGLLSSTTTTTKDEAKSTTAVGTSLSGESILIKAGNDITTRGASVVATNGVALNAGNSIDIGTAQNTSHEFHSKDSKTSGIFSDGGTGVSIGSQKQASTVTVDTVTNTGSVIGSLDGAVSIVAGKNVTVTGSDVLSQTGTLISGQNVTLQNATDTQTTVQTNKTSSSGLHVYLKGGAADVANSLIGSAQGAANASDPRLKALYAAHAAQTLLSNGKAGLNSLKEAANGNTLNADGSGMSLRVGLGASSSSSTATSTTNTSVGSTIKSSGEILITARGDDNGNGGDLTVHGSSVSGHNVTLDANRDLILKSSQDTEQVVAKNTHKAGEIGLTMGGEAGIGVYVSASGAKGSGNGESTTHRETQISATNTLQTNSGRDTTLTGAQARGDTIIATVGRDLTITSEQDTDTYKRKDTNAGIDAAFGTGGGSVSVSANQTKISADYKSVNEQSGIEAGEGGYTVTVGNHTQLNGGAIVSSADPSKNSLSTQTLGATTLTNTAKYNANSVGFSGGAGTGGAGLSPSMGVPQNETQSSITQSAISSGTIDIRSGDTHSSANINRDQTTLQMQGLTNTFDEQKVREAMEMGNLAGQVGFRAAGDIAQHFQAEALKALNSATNREEADVALNKLKQWSDGGSMKIATHAFIGGLMSALGGSNATGGVLGAGFAEAARKIDLDNSALGQQIVSAIVGALVGDGSGAAVALSAEQNNRQLHPKEISAILNGLAEKFAMECGCSLEEAQRRLIRQAAQNVDQLHDLKLGVDDEQAKAFLGRNQFKFVDEYGANVSAFDATFIDRSNPNKYVELYQTEHDKQTAVWRAIFGALAKPGEQLSLSDGLKSLSKEEYEKYKALALWVKENPDEAKDAARKVLKSIDEWMSQDAGEWAKKKFDEIWTWGTAEAKACLGNIAHCTGNNDKTTWLASVLYGYQGNPDDFLQEMSNYNTAAAALFLLDFAGGGAKAGVRETVDALESEAKHVLSDATNKVEKSVGHHEGRTGISLEHSEYPTVEHLPMPDTGHPKITIDDLLGKTFPGPTVTMGARNDGKIGEKAAIEFLNEMTGYDIRPLQNCSNHGCDGVFIDEVTKTIHVFEVKSSQNGVSKAASAAGNPSQRLEVWVSRSLRTWGDSQPSSNRLLARKIEQLMRDSEFKIQGTEVRIGVPKPGQTGKTEIKFGPWGR